MLRQTYALMVRELKHWYRVKIQIFLTLIQPLFWLLLFGQAFRFPLPPEALNGAPNYFSYMAIGMLSIVTLFTCMFSGMSIVWDRRFGFLNKLRASPIERGVIPTSRVLATVIRSLISALIVLGLAVLFAYVPGLEGLEFYSGFNLLDLLGMFLVLFLVALGFAAAFTMMALKIRSQEALFGVINLVNLPLLFASNALFPIDQMPSWLQAVAKANPITWSSDALRHLAFDSQTSVYSLGTDLALLIGFAVVLVGLGALLARRVLAE
jgi:ABC-2 type transport system permease protein